jgi:hypothetical protein
VKRLIPVIVVIFSLCSCASLKDYNSSMQPAQKPTYMMNSEAKIQYYQEQINHYQFLIDQEKKKQEVKK